MAHLQPEGDAREASAVVLSAALAAVLLLGVAVVSSGVAQQPGPPTGTLDLVQLNRESSFKFIDYPPRGGEEREPSPGDMAIIGATLRYTSNRRAGRLHVVFTRLEGRRKFVDRVSATFRVEGGYIVVGGISDGGRTDDVAIMRKQTGSCTRSSCRACPRHRGLWLPTG